ncbi:MAG: NAD(P)-dependent oxidoreductase [Chloroflexi bacterium]|nr:NAD(P)-dependent oxidoreductase [Chloroflexota bacterium]
MGEAVKRVGFIGLGDIGLPMARRIVTGGYETVVCGHRRREPVEEMKRLGAREVKTAREVAQATEAVIVMVQNDKQAEEVIFGADGLLQGVKAGDGILLMGTFSPAFCKRVAVAAGPKKVEVFDAPVVGARMGAEAGTLGISVGGDKPGLERYRPVLERLGKITYCGPLGMGQIVKLVNNMAAVINGRVAYEAIAWGMRNGASEEMLVNHLKNGSGNSFIIQNWEWLKSYFKYPPPPTYYVGGKDLRYALEIAHEIDQPCPIAALVCELQKTGPPRLPEPPQS